MDNPLLESTSPSDFWGRRWNSLVQTCLKNGMFKVSVKERGCTTLVFSELTSRLSFQPVYKHFSKAAGVMATFVASGLLHEWLVLVICSTRKRSAGDVEVVYGGSMVFFIWQAMLILVESRVGNWEIFKTMGRILPAPLRTALIVCAGIPVRVLYLAGKLGS